MRRLIRAGGRGAKAAGLDTDLVELVDFCREGFDPAGRYNDITSFADFARRVLDGFNRGEEFYAAHYGINDGSESDMSILNLSRQLFLDARSMDDITDMVNLWTAS